MVLVAHLVFSMHPPAKVVQLMISLVMCQELKKELEEEKSKNLSMLVSPTSLLSFRQIATMHRMLCTA